MITVQIVCVGSVKESYYKNAIAEFTKRLSRFCKLNIIELEEYKAPQKVNESIIANIVQKESESILKHLNGYVILLDILGQNLTSPQLAKKLSDTMLTNSTVTFVIGGSHGVSDELKQKANYLLSFSSFTFPHQLMRVFLLEQIYRGFTILNNITYHK